MSLRELWLRFTYPLRKARLDRELREEMALHVALRAEELTERGWSRANADAAARRRFGNQSRIAAASRETWGWHWLDGFAQDTRYILRQLRRAPGFALVVCATIALGIVINATAFTFYDAIVLKPLPVADPARVVRVVREGNAFGFELVPYSAYDVLRRDAHMVEAVVATTGPQSFAAVLPGHAANDPSVVSVRFVTPEFARALGVHARIGRWFDPSDENGVVLDHAFWAREFAADPAVVGRVIRFSNVTLPVLGVAPENFAGTGMPAVAPNLWLPASTVTSIAKSDWRNDGRSHWQVLGRIAATASLTAANAELTALRRSVPDSVGTPLPLVARKATYFQTDAGEFEVFQQASVVFLAALVLLLGIAGVNLVNLFAARNASRESEVTVRLALGANRRRIARQLASESVLLALAGGGLGLSASRLFASWLERWMTTTMSAISGGLVGVSLDLTTDWRIALYTVALSIGIGLVVGLWPALRASGADINAKLRRGVTSTAGSAQWGKRNALLAVQIASCTVLLTSAGALLGGMRLSHRIDPRFDADHILIVDLPDDEPIAERMALRAGVAERLRALAGVRAVSWTRRVPFGGTHLRTVNHAGGLITLALDDVAESYFDVMGMPVVRGRTFSREDVERDAPVMVVSESAARLRWPAGDALGRSVPPNDPLGGPDTTQAYTVIGIVPDIRSQFLSRMNGPAVYYPYGLHKERGALMLRTRGNPGSVVNDVRAAIASVSPALANRSHVLTMQDGPMALQRLMAQVPATIALCLALAGLLLASVGVYGVISQIVTRRTREIAIHLAMGANRRRVLSMIAVKTLRPVAWGLSAGGVLAVGVSLLLRSLIAAADAPDLTFGAGALNPAVFCSVAGVLAFVVAAAFAGPARRALAVDLVGSLRAD